MKPLLALLLLLSVPVFSQKPCSNAVFRQFDFWLGKRSDDGGQTWKTAYDQEYRRRK